MATDKHNRRYEIVAYDPTWSEQFSREASRLRDAFGSSALVVEHVGSSAVPGMVGKPTLDILVTTARITDADEPELVARLAALGYEALGAYVAPEGRLFAKEADGHRLINVHVFEPTSRKGKEMLVVRDYLRAHPEDVREYGALKTRLFAEHSEDYAGYRAKKTALVEELVARAWRWHTSKSFD